MKYDEFVERKRFEADDSNHFIILDEDHCLRLSYGSPEHFEDRGWPRETNGDGYLVLVGAIMNHRKPDGGMCGGGITFARPKNPSDSEKEAPIWKIEQLDPLTIIPSVQCHCNGPNTHGHITAGKWVPAG